MYSFSKDISSRRSTRMNVVLLSCLFLLMVTTSVSASMNINAHRGRIPIIFANRDKMSKTNSYRRGRRGSTNTEIGSNSNHHDSIKDTRIQNTSSSRSYSKYYTSNEFEDGEDAFDEWDRLERMKKDLQKQLGGYRPWSIDTSSSRLGKVSWTSKLVLTNLVMFGLQMAMPSITKFGAKRSELILQGRELHRLITPIFLHGSPTHIMLNTFSLRNIGPEVERLFGGGRFLTTYLAAGVAGNLMSAYYSPNPSIGASGAVFGLMGAYYAFLSQNERLLGRSGQDAMSRVSGTLAMNVLFGLASPGIDNWAHIGGAIGGATMAITFGPKLSVLGLPGGGSIVVDKPYYRLPPSIENIPGSMSKRFRRAKLRMQVDRYVSELSAKPWRRNRGRPRRTRRTKRPIRPMFGG